MVWLTDEEVAVIKTSLAQEVLPGTFELQRLSRQLSDGPSRERAEQLLQAFAEVAPQACPDAWYGQLEHLRGLAKALGDERVEQHCLQVNTAVREASRQSVRIIKNDDQRKRIREEMRAMDEKCPASRAEVSRSSSGMQVPASDLAEVLLQGGPLLQQRVRDAGYTIETKEFGRQGAIPSQTRLAAIKEGLVAELGRSPELAQAVGARTGGDAVTQFRSTIRQSLDIDMFCVRGQDGISISDLFTVLPAILEARQRHLSDVSREIVARFMAFRIDFATICNPQEEYMPIFEAVFELFRCVDGRLVSEHGQATLSMFRAMFAIVLDPLCSARVSSYLGAGTGALVGALGAGAAEAAWALGLSGRAGPLTAFAGGALACAVAVKALVYVVDRWVQRSSRIRVCSLFRRNETGAWRVWIIELIH